jgi:hypothetical protein
MRLLPDRGTRFRSLSRARRLAQVSPETLLSFMPGFPADRGLIGGLGTGFILAGPIFFGRRSKSRVLLCGVWGVCLVAFGAPAPNAFGASVSWRLGRLSRGVWGVCLVAFGAPAPNAFGASVSWRLGPRPQALLGEALLQVPQTLLRSIVQAPNASRRSIVQVPQTLLREALCRCPKRFRASAKHFRARSRVLANVTSGVRARRHVTRCSCHRYSE